MQRLYGEFVGGRKAWGLLILRLMAGPALMLHGWSKIQNAFGWMDKMPGPHIPGLFQFLAAFAEFGGGLALILGLLTWFAALGITFNFVVATLVVAVMQKLPFVNPDPRGGSFEPAAFYLAVGLLMLLTGPGTLSLDALLFGKKPAVMAGGALPHPAGTA